MSEEDYIDRNSISFGNYESYTSTDITITAIDSDNYITLEIDMTQDDHERIRHISLNLSEEESKALWEFLSSKFKDRHEW
jgi:hypothetical protein